MGGSASKSRQQSQQESQAIGTSRLFGPQAELFSQLLPQAGEQAASGLVPGGELQEQGQGFLDVLSRFSEGGNQFLQGQIDILGENIGRNLQQNILPGIGSQATAFGGRGGSRQGIAEGLAAQGAQTEFRQGAQNLLFQGGQQQQQRRDGIIHAPAELIEAARDEL